MKVIKVNGQKEELVGQKIFSGIWRAAKEVGEKDQQTTRELKNKILQALTTKYPNGEVIKTAEIGELVEKVLIEHGQRKIAKAFILHRENKRHFHQDKSTLGIKDDIGLSYNTLYILKRRFLKRNEKNEIIETPAGMIKRVARFLSRAETTKKLQIEWEKKFTEIMLSLEFLPGTRTLVNAGKPTPQLANCFVWPIEDDIDEIFGTLHQSTLIKKHGGGCGYNFSRVRPERDLVSNIPELAAGPVKMIEMYDLMTSLFKQEGHYESGNMAILNADHPDIFNFVSAKQTDGYLAKTNLSVGITDEFMKAALANKDWHLINPRTGEKVNTVKAKSILQLMAQMAWATGDPGIINLSAINRGTALANPLLKKRGPIEATNVCGEIPSYPYESCNLGYLNLTKFIKGKRFIYERLKEVVSIAVRLMDNVIESSWFPVPQVTKAVRDHRRIGIGVVGWAETLTQLEISYNSPKARGLAEKITQTMYQAAFKTSCALAEEKGPFPLVNDSIWAQRKKKPRNVALLTFPPSSSNAAICETSFGIEPYFAIAYEQNVLGGMRLKTIVPLFVEKLKEWGIYSPELIQKIIDNHGSVQGIKEVPQDLQRIFKVAHDLSWQDHLRMQAAFQKYCDNAITKTINLPFSATPAEIEKAFVLAWKLGCKGLTVYRDRTKKDQVINFGKEEKEKRLCPECLTPLQRKNKCLKCSHCAFSTCEL